MYISLVSIAFEGASEGPKTGHRCRNVILNRGDQKLPASVQTAGERKMRFQDPPTAARHTVGTGQHGPMNYVESWQRYVEACLRMSR